MIAPNFSFLFNFNSVQITFIQGFNNNNNNNNNYYYYYYRTGDVHGAVIMAEDIARVHSVYLITHSPKKCRTAQNGRQLLHKTHTLELRVCLQTASVRTHYLDFVTPPVCCVSVRDENGEPSCAVGYVKCPTSDRCVREQWLCDADDDCGDNSDENPSFCGMSTVPRYRRTTLGPFLLGVLWPGTRCRTIYMTCRVVLVDLNER